MARSRKHRNVVRGSAEWNSTLNKLIEKASRHRCVADASVGISVMWLESLLCMYDVSLVGQSRIKRKWVESSASARGLYKTIRPIWVTFDYTDCTDNIRRRITVFGRDAAVAFQMIDTLGGKSIERFHKQSSDKLLRL